MNFRCEFCEIALKSDLDVSKHLVSQPHRENVEKARQLHPLENAKGKDVPTNIVKLYENLKLRTVHDVRDLADRGYFRLPAEATETVKVVGAINRVLVKKVAEHLTRNMGPAAKQEVLDSLNAIKKEPPERRQPPKAPVNQQSARPPQPTPQAPQPDQRPEKQPTAPKASTSEVVDMEVDFRPAPAYTPLVASTSKPTAATVRPNIAGPSHTPQVRNVRPNLTTATTIPSNNQREPRPKIPQPATRTVNQPSVNPFNQASRPTAPRPNIPHGPPRQPAQARPTPPQPRATAPQPRATGPQPRASMPQPRPAVHQSRTVTPQSRATPPQPRTYSRPDRPMAPPPPMAGAYFMPRPLVDEPPPQPRQDSTYRPRLAQIKIEPKDK